MKQFVPNWKQMLWLQAFQHLKQFTKLYHQKQTNFSYLAEFLISQSLTENNATSYTHLVSKLLQRSQTFIHIYSKDTIKRVRRKEKKNPAHILTSSQNHDKHRSTLDRQSREAISLSRNYQGENHTPTKTGRASYCT